MARERRTPTFQPTALVHEAYLRLLGGGRQRVTLTDGTLRYEATPEDLLALDAALDELTARDPSMARVVELRYFGGLTVPETAVVLGTSVRSVIRLWAAARAWLHRALGPPPGAGATHREGHVG